MFICYNKEAVVLCGMVLIRWLCDNAHHAPPGDIARGQMTWCAAWLPDTPPGVLIRRLIA